MQTYPIQWILLGGIGLSLVLAVAVLKNQLLGRLFFICQFVLGMVFVLVPDLSSRLARLVGIGRGTDLILYLFIVFCYLGGLSILAKFRRLERNQTLLVRKLAIASVQVPPRKQVAGSFEGRQQ
ncbi:DUF2304 domain-containing protein [Oligosphaera ethanolica]|uniref:DUF2304 domain-containing protein n=1 Tax=Oligosphaera ethanolica TaxID=760260 RepID=A0AAE3VDM2_9BACT|nr:DUF2304 domain-containing protein [Oligosphaera ethanolica]MDQ0288530.1 hypothetical protein [Oligosphaera ethanolica]